MKNVLKILIFLFLSFQIASAKEINFIYISDINLNTQNAPYLKQTIKEINQLKNIDFVVFGGNNIQKPDINNLNTFLYLIKKLHKKAYVILGSNDVLKSSGIDKKYYMERVNKALKYMHGSDSGYTFKNKGQLFIVADGAKQYFQSTNGYYPKDELMRIANILDKNKDKNIIILQHFPILESSSKWIETAKTEDYYKLLSEHDNVKAIIAGHYNTNIEVEKNGVMHIITESYAKNHAFKLIKIDTDDDFIAGYLIK